MKECLVCKRIDMIKQGTNKYFVKELETGYVVIGDYQYFNGYTLFLNKEHVVELHHLDHATKIKFLEEMSIVGQAVYNAFNPDKLNYELLGNGEAHMHWHIFPRVQGDTSVKGPVWWLSKEIMYSDEVRPNTKQLNELKCKLLTELDKLLNEKE